MERAGRGRDALIPPPSLLTPDTSEMPAPWLLLTMALTLTLTDVPGGCAQPDVAQQEAVMAAEHPGLGDLLRQAERLSLLREDLQQLRGEQGDRESGEGPGCPGLPRQGGRGEGWGKRRPRAEGATWSISRLPFTSSETLTGRTLGRVVR